MRLVNRLVAMTDRVICDVTLDMSISRCLAEECADYTRGLTSAADLRPEPNAAIVEETNRSARPADAPGPDRCANATYERAKMPNRRAALHRTRPPAHGRWHRQRCETEAAHRSASTRQTYRGLVS